jgi:two-component system NtrC family response regulator
MSSKSHVDLLRVLETGQFNRVGGEELLQSDARVISATNCSVDEWIADGDFREDLYYRLNSIPIEVPPRRRRREDIPLLVEHCLEQFCTRRLRLAQCRSVLAQAIRSRWQLSATGWPCLLLKHRARTVASFKLFSGRSEQQGRKHQQVAHQGGEQ